MNKGMGRAILFLFLALGLSLVAGIGSRPAAAQFNTPTVDGTISPGEYGDHIDGQNQQTSGSQVWYMTWDDNNLYVGITGANIYEGAILYLDRNPLAPINGGTNADGTIVGFNYDNTCFAALQFRADIVLYVKNGYREYRIADGANGWSAPTTGWGSYADNSGTNTREFALPWSAVGGRPASFAWFGYLTSSGGYVYGPVPIENPGGYIGTAARYARYYIINNTNNGTSTKPFSRNCYVFNSESDISDFGALSVYDFTMNTAGRTITRAGGNWTIGGDMRVDNGTVNFGAITDGTTVSGDVVVGSGGTLILSSNAGGDLSVGGDWTNNGTFNCRGRQVTFNGSGPQTVGGSASTTFDYLLIDNAAAGVVTLTTDITVTRQLKINDSSAELSAGGTTLTLRGDSTAGPVFWNEGTFNPGTSTVVFSGENNRNARIWGSPAIATTFNNVTISRNPSGSGNFGVDFYDHDTGARAHIAGTLTLNQFTFVASEENGSSTGCPPSNCDGTPFYDAGSTLRYNNSGSFASAAEWWPDDATPTCGTDKGMPYNVIITNNTALNIHVGFANNGQSPNYPAGSNKTACGSVTIASGSALTSTSGILSVKNDWTRAGTFAHNGGTVRFNGTSAQTIWGSSPTTFYNLTVNNASGVSLGQNERVENTLTLSNGRLTLGSYDLVLGSGATAVGGTLNASNMVVADGTGQLCKEYAAAAPYTFPIGDATGTAEYSPATLDLSGTFTSGQACINLTDEKHPNNPSPNDYLTRYWTVTSTGISNFTCTTTFNYVDADVTGTEENIHALRYHGGTWTMGNLVDAGNNRFSMTVNVFSDFTGGAIPAAVKLLSFAARPAASGIYLTWETASEYDNLGFNLYRSSSPQDRGERLNATLIPSCSPGGGEGATYEFLDTTARPGQTYSYILEDVDRNGRRTPHGPAVIVYRQVYLPLLFRRR